MKTIHINSEKAAALDSQAREKLVSLCPFSAIEVAGDMLSINSACKLCGICVKQSGGVITIVEEQKIPAVDKTLWRGIAVFIDCTEGHLHPVSLELLGKAKELAAEIKHPVQALVIGHDMDKVAEEMRYFGADEIYVYDDARLEKFLIEPYTNVFEDFVKTVKPSSILVGATNAGRSLAPRAAARLQTGLTADCTKLQIKENTDLVQIRPAFGGNIMAQIITPNHRPQFATVRYKIFSALERSNEPSGVIHKCKIDETLLTGRITPVSSAKKEQKHSISDAEIIIACGRGFKAQKDLDMARELAELLGGEIACTRPLIEAGWIDASRQIGLSGRTVKPKLIITLGISGAVQFKAGMENAEMIIAMNADEHAPIFDVCHYAVVGDLYEIVPRMIEKLRSEKGRANV